MPFVSQFGELVYHLTLEDDPEEMLVTCGVGFAAVPDSADVAAMVDAWLVAWSDNLKSSLSSDYTMKRATARVNAGGTELEVEQVTNTPGTGGTGVLPQNCALLVRKTTGLTGRKNRGRMYWPGMTGETSVTPQGMITGSVVTTLQGHFDDWLADCTTVDFVPVINHGDMTIPAIVSGLTVENRIATQRRRLRP